MEERRPLLTSIQSGPTFHSSVQTVLYSSALNLLLVFFPLGLLAGYLEWSDTTTFLLNFFAIIPLAKILGLATEEIAMRTSQTIGGLLNATFGNLVELMVSVLALKSGLIRVVQASLLGSILSNLLLVMGFSLFLGGLYVPEQTFNATAAQLSASLMTLSVSSILLPAAFSAVTDDSALMLQFSRGTAVVLLVVYVMYLLFSLRTHSHLFEDDEIDDEEAPSLTYPVAISLLVIDSLMIAFSADYLVGSIEGLAARWSLSESFIGLIIIPIVGNAAEHVTAVTSALKNKMELAMGIAVGSSNQIALLVVPVTVIAGWIMHVPMTLHFSNFETVVLFISVFIINSIIGDGKSNWLEGAMLLSVYTIIALAFYILP